MKSRSGTEIKLYKSVGKSLIFLTMSIIGILAYIGLIYIEPHFTLDSIEYSWSIILLVFGIGVGFVSMFNQRAQMIISVDGIWSSIVNEGIIPWEQIQSAFLYKNDEIYLVLNESFIFKNTPNRLKDDAKQVLINPSHLEFDTEALLNMINILCSHTRDKRAVLLETYTSIIKSGKKLIVKPVTADYPFDRRIEHLVHYFQKQSVTNTGFQPEYKAAKAIHAIALKGDLSKKDIREIVAIFNKANQKPHYNGSGWFDLSCQIRGALIAYQMTFDILPNKNIVITAPETDQ